MGVKAYMKTIRETSQPREIERKVFARITHELASAENDGPVPSAALRESLVKNQELWSIIRADVASPENNLPEDVRGQLLNLSYFVDRHTWGVLKGEKDVQALVDINKTIMKGLGL